MHGDVPALSLYFPFSHSLHRASPAALLQPVGHNLQLLSFAKVPGIQGSDSLQMSDESHFEATQPVAEISVLEEDCREKKKIVSCTVCI